jgi:hypothetical protein
MEHAGLMVIEPNDCMIMMSGHEMRPFKRKLH